MKKITENLETQLDNTYSLLTWMGDDCLKKAAILLRLLPTEWAMRIQRANMRKQRRATEQQRTRGEQGGSKKWI